MNNKFFRGAVLTMTAVILALVLGIIVIRSWNDRKYIYAGSGDWQKLDLVLQQIEENYVDTVDTEAISEALIQKALQELDPHSV